MIDQVQKLIEPLRRKIALMVGRAVIKTVKDSGDLQLLQLLINAGEVRSDIQRLQEYGFTSNPKAGAEAAVVFLNGNRDHGIVLAVEDRRYRLKGLASGEVALYDDQGQIVKLKRSGIEINSPLQIDIVSGGDINVTAEGDVNVQAANVNVDAETATVTAPETDVIAETGVTMTTPLLAVSGLVSCAGIAAGGATPESGKAKITGSVEATGDVHSSGGNVQDSAGTMATMRSTFNSHHHGALTGVGTTPTPTM